MNSLIDTYKLNNECEIPCIGFGTWQTPDGKTAVDSVKCAIENGYRHIDTAAIYGNEKGVGQGIIESKISREELFVTSKVFNTDRGYEKTLAAFKKTLNDLKLEYLDLYLIHWPANKKQFDNWEEINIATWKAMSELYLDGKIKAIGVSNFLPHHLDGLVKTEVLPAVNQIEYHPGQMQDETVKYCKANDILIEAWSPLGTGKMLTNELLNDIAKKYNKSIAQVCIRWCLQNGTLPLPKSVTPSRIKENKEIFDFEISEDDMITINNMQSFGSSGLHPDEVDF